MKKLFKQLFCRIRGNELIMYKPNYRTATMDVVCSKCGRKVR